MSHSGSASTETGAPLRRPAANRLWEAGVPFKRLIYWRRSLVLCIDFTKRPLSHPRGAMRERRAVLRGIAIGNMPCSAGW
jgi:hypothetical protein